MAFEQISQRDLRMRSREIMDAVEHGRTFTVTRDGHEIGRLVPLRRRRAFISREEFIALGRSMPLIDPEAFRADLDRDTDQLQDDPFAR